MVDLEGNEDIIAGAVHCLLNRDLEPTAADLLSANKGCPLNKGILPEGHEFAGEPDVRPVGMGSKLRQLATSVSNSYHSDKLKTDEENTIEGTLRRVDDFFLEHRQFGMCVKGGLESMIHFLRLLTELWPTNVLLKFDAVNAFGTINRQKAVDVLQKEFPDTQQPIKNFYGRSSTTFYTDVDGTILRMPKEVGADQGDVYGGLIFCAGYSHALKKTQAKFAGMGVYLVSFHDDSYLHCPPRLVNQVVRYFRKACREINLELHEGKYQMWRPSGPIPATVLPEIVGDQRDSGVMVCGTPIGGILFVTDTLQAVVDGYNSLHELTIGLPDAQCQYLLPKYCTCCNLVHWLRTVPPRVMHEFAEQYDEATLQTLETILKTGEDRQHMGMSGLSALQVLQFRQHARKGGLGLPGSVFLTIPAWLGSWCQNKPLIQKLLGTNGNLLDDISGNSRDLQSFRDITDAHAAIAAVDAEVNAEIVPELDRLEQLKTKAQRSLTEVLYRKLDRDIMEACECDHDTARLRSCKGYGASAWLSAIPKLPMYVMKPAIFRVALRLRLGMTQSCIFNTVCSGCQGRRGAPDPRGDHYLTCTEGGPQLGFRHDKVLDPLVNMLRTSGHVTRCTGLTDLIQDRNLATGMRLVPDALCIGWHDDGRDCCFDVAVTHPCAASYVQNAAGRALHAATDREKRKCAKYSRACNSQGLAFKPFVIETYGAFSTEAQATVKAAVAKMAAKLPNDAFSELAMGTWTASSFRSHFLQRISIALQRGNAIAIQSRALRDFKLAGSDERATSPPRENLQPE
jgi:hypothetical protein